METFQWVFEYSARWDNRLLRLYSHPEYRTQVQILSIFQFLVGSNLWNKVKFKNYSQSLCSSPAYVLKCTKIYNSIWCQSSPWSNKQLSPRLCTHLAANNSKSVGRRYKFKRRTNSLEFVLQLPGFSHQVSGVNHRSLLLDLADVSQTWLI